MRGSGSACACETLETDLSLDEAHAILEPFFLSVRDLFLAAGLTKIKQTKFVVAHGLHDTARHFAACDESGLTILAAPELAELGTPLALGILAHECGHATDFLYPGEFALGGERVLRRVRDDVSEGQWVRWARSWRDRDDDVVEITADKIAEGVWGSPIGYAGPCKLQNFRTGEARPVGLR